MADVNPWIPIATAAMGMGATLLTVVVSQWSTSRRDHSARRHEVEERRRQQRNDFQVKTMLALQDAAQEYCHSTTDIIISIKNQFDNGGTQDTIAITTELADAHAKNFHQLLILSARVQDDAIRELSQTLRDVCEGVLSIESKDEATKLIPQIGGMFRLLNERIGVVLRELY